MIKHYKLEECKAVKCIAEGGENKKRPITLEGNKWQVGDASDALGVAICHGMTLLNDPDSLKII